MATVKSAHRLASSTPPTSGSSHLRQSELGSCRWPLAPSTCLVWRKVAIGAHRGHLAPRQCAGVQSQEATDPENLSLNSL